MKPFQTLALMSTLADGAALADTVNFDDLKTGAPPPGWTSTKTGKGQAKWEIVADDSAPSKPNVLKQSGEATYPVCIKDDSSLKDGYVEVKFKPISGKEDQAGGVIWRCKDSDNYYVSRANALEDNVTIYHTVNGKRSEKKRFNTKVASNKWHTLRVDFKDNYFVVTFDGKRVFVWRTIPLRTLEKLASGPKRTALRSLTILATALIPKSRSRTSSKRNPGKKPQRAKT